MNNAKYLSLRNLNYHWNMKRLNVAGKITLCFQVGFIHQETTLFLKQIKFIHSEKAAKFCEIFPLLKALEKSL